MPYYPRNDYDLGDYMNIATTIKNVRTSAGLSQIDFAAAVGCQQTTVSKWELGKMLPSMGIAKKIIRLARKYEIALTMEDFFGTD